MKVAKWGNSLAIRIPAEVVNKLKLVPGEEIEIKVTGEGQFQVRRDDRRERAIQRLRELRIKVPYPYKFDRNEIYDS